MGGWLGYNVTAPTAFTVGKDGKIKKRMLVRSGYFINNKPVTIGDPDGPACPRCQYQMVAGSEHWFCPACAFHSQDDPNFRFEKKGKKRGKS